MRHGESKSIGKYLVLSGYVLLVLIMLVGLWAIYKNLVDFSHDRVRNEDRQELIIVSNIINQLYEAEGTTDLMTYDSATDYIDTFLEIKPQVGLKIDSLKQLTEDAIRVAQLDSIEVLLDMKEENLMAVLSLMDSLRKVPPIIRESVNTFVPKRLNSDISMYIEEKIIDEIIEEANTDTTVIRREKKGLFKRLGDAISGREDSTVILENHPTRVVQRDFSLIIDTIVNMVRYSERLNLESQKKFQIALVNRQTQMNYTNQILTARVDELLKHIEQEELEKSLSLVEAKETTLSKSYNTVYTVSIIAILIAVVFGLLFVIDINKSQRYKRRLEKSNRQIKKLLKSREKLMLSIFHDIKAPMSSILGYIELMESKSNEESHDTYLNNMKLSGEHVLHLVTNLLDYQKIESNTWIPNEMNFNVKDFVSTTIDSFAPLAAKKNLSFNVTNDVDSSLLAYGDPFMIREIYSNIISNAIKYTLDGYVDVRVEYSEEDSTLSLIVKDTGVGISEEDRHLVYEEFEQIKVNNIDHFVEGSGLGLAITKGLVEQLNGEISFESEAGKGTEFIVDLPLDKSKESFSSTDKRVDLTSDYEISGLSVLVVDDDAIQQTMVSEMLKTQGVSVYSETNPVNVLNVLKKQSFDLIFLDIQMPNINGFALIKQIRDSKILKDKVTPIIALTATSEIDLQEYINSGFTAYLNKPFTSKELFDVIASSISDKTILSYNEEETDSKGIESLISYVREDQDSSLAILEAFVSECTSLNNFLDGKVEVSQTNNSSSLAHKMLPLFKIIGDKEVSNCLLNLEKGGKVSKKEMKQTIDIIDVYIKQAQDMIDDLRGN